MKRFSVLYLLNERYNHIPADSQAEARALIEKLSVDKRCEPVGIYDTKTELIEWESSRQQDYDQATIGDQAKLNHQVVTIAQALRRRDSSWQLPGDFNRPSLFA